MEQLQLQLNEKEAELSALPDVPENAEARALLQADIASLQVQISALELQLVQDRISALGDVALLLGQYIAQHSANVQPADSYNIAGFEAHTINTPFGWIFEQVSKPTLEQLELIKAGME